MKPRNVSDLVRQQEELAETTVKIYNPLFSDFEIVFNEETVVAPSQEITEYPYVTGMYIAKHLRDKIINERKISQNIYAERERIMEEILI